MKIRRQKYIWTCGDGSEIRVCDMDDEHLENAIKFLERLAKKRKDAIMLETYKEHFDSINDNNQCFEVTLYFHNRILALKKADITTFMDNEEAYKAMFIERERRRRKKLALYSSANPIGCDHMEADTWDASDCPYY